MNAYTVLLIMIVCGIEAHPTEFWPNVGSVLFTREDLNKQIWTKKDVALLTARRYFQKLIPPPSFITVENEFVDKMLAYFRDTYTAIKTVSPDQEVDRIMTTALSDTVGGYLKLCVLPVTKLSFYGGIASYDSAYKVFRFYSEIKKYLCTDGQNWRSPDQQMLNAVILNVPKVVRQKKQMLNAHDPERNKDPCTSFNYFEKTPKGLVVPMPVVNWDDVSMFLPVHNESTFSLHSPKHCNTLENYYNKAKNCMNSKSDAGAAEFDQKFQHWLSSDILPHLKDDRLYVALGNVLGLLNKTREMCDVILDVYNSSSKSTSQDVMSIFCSKTSIIVIIILIFEIIWCIVAIDRLCCKKTTDYEDNNDNRNKVLSYFRTCSNREHMQYKGRKTNEFEVKHKEEATNKPSFVKKWSAHSNYTEMDRDISCLPITMEAGCQNEPSIKYRPSIGVGTKSKSQSSFRYQVRSSDVFTIVNERIKDLSSRVVVPLNISNRSYTKIPSTICGVVDCDARDSCSCHPKKLHDDQSSTFARSKNKSAITIYSSQKSVDGSQAIFRSRQEKDFERRNAMSEYKLKESLRKFSPYSVAPVSCAYRNCPDDTDVSMELNVPSIQEATTDSLICSLDEPSTVTKKGKTISEMQTVITKVDKETETHKHKKKNLVSNYTSSVTFNTPKDKKGKQSQRKRFLEIKIDRPKAEIKLGISGAQISPRKGLSKIPTRKSARHAQTSTIKRPYEVTSILPEYVDKSINSVIQCIEQSTDYTLTQQYTMYHVSAEEDSKRVFNQTTQDITSISKSSNTDNRSIASKQEKGAGTKSNERDLSLMTIKRSESDPTKISRYTADVGVLCTNLKQDTEIENKTNGTGLDQDTNKMTDKDRLIHTIYEHSKEALLSVLATEEESTVKEKIRNRESCEIVIESTDEPEPQKKESYILSKCQVNTKGNPDTSQNLTKTNINPETSKMTKRQKSTDLKKTIIKPERVPENKIPKRNNDTPWMTARPPEVSSNDKTSVRVDSEQSCHLSHELEQKQPVTENDLEKASIVLKKSDTYTDTTLNRQEEDGSSGPTNSSPVRKSKIPQLMRIDNKAHRALNAEVRLNLSF